MSLVSGVTFGGLLAYGATRTSANPKDFLFLFGKYSLIPQGSPYASGLSLMPQGSLLCLRAFSYASGLSLMPQGSHLCLRPLTYASGLSLCLRAPTYASGLLPEIGLWVKGLAGVIFKALI